LNRLYSESAALKNITKKQGIKMKPFITAGLILLASLLASTGCSSEPPRNSQNNSADSQRQNAKQAQDELSSETSK